MLIKKPLNTDKYYWTRHAWQKMKQYGLSAQRVIRVIRSPQRVEKGIVGKTIAVMQPVSIKRNSQGQKEWKSEIWVMYYKKPVNSKKPLNNLLPGPLKIISVWRYPGVSSSGQSVPQEIIEEISELAGEVD